MTQKYNPRNYKKDQSTIEKIFFSAPEYIVFETKIGGWIAFQLQKVLGWINEFSSEKIPKTRDTLQRKLIEFITDLISSILNWINYFIEEREIERKRMRRRR
jgi:hypothetical protein